MALTKAATLDSTKFAEFLNSILSFLFDSKGSVIVNSFTGSRLKLQNNLVSQYFSDTSDTEDLNGQIEEEISLILEVFLRADKESFDNAKLESILKKTDLTSAQKKLFVDIWITNKEKVQIHRFI